MTTVNRDTLGYLGTNFQRKLTMHLLTDHSVAYDLMPYMKSVYFDDAVNRKLFIEVKDYYDEFNAIPSSQNLKVAIAQKDRLKDTEKQQLDELLKVIGDTYKSLVSSGNKYQADKEFTQKTAWQFIKQQEYKGCVEEARQLLRNGNIDDSPRVAELFQSALKIGQTMDLGKEMFQDFENVVEEQKRSVIDPCIPGLAEVMRGGLGKGQVGMIIAPSGIGKTTTLVKIAFGCIMQGKNVLLVLFEDEYEDVQRKIFSLVTQVPIQELKERKEEVLVKLKAFQNDKSHGQIVLKKFPEEDTTIPVIREWVLNYQKKTDIHFEMLVIDYLDCVESHKERNDVHREEISVMKSLMHLTHELDIPTWTAVQGNRSSMDAEIVDGGQMGGSIKRYQKAHFVMSISKRRDQKEQNQANIAILKSRFGPDGMVYKDCYFDNALLDIRLSDSSITAKQAIMEDQESFNDDKVNYIRDLLKDNVKRTHKPTKE